MRTLFLVLAGLWALCAALPSQAESQGSDYRGIQDPFGDPASYEFADDEKEDKEFFHLGRYMMLGVDVGAAIFTGGLGVTTEPGMYIGGRLIYFFDKSIAFEGAGHFSQHRDLINPDATTLLDLDVVMIPINVGFRYYFDTKSAPKAIAIANPYLAFGGGAYIKQETVVDQKGFNNVSGGSTTSFGGYGGGGVEFTIYRRHVYLGLDLRYHLVFFPGEGDETFDGTLNPGDRAGDYFTTALMLTYNF